ncbi:MAG: hypothetical protein QME12_05925 [Nanoarchaeota archaeon]|nr:hypothetical protein [Nanoarchaeota archaeon]
MEYKTIRQDKTFGPNTAGLAQRIYAKTMERPLYVLQKANVLKCAINQF